MKLVSDWRDVWRYYSTQVLVLIAMIPVVWGSIPYDVQMLLPDAWRPWLLSLMALAGVAGRMVRQGD